MTGYQRICLFAVLGLFAWLPEAVSSVRLEAAESGDSSSQVESTGMHTIKQSPSVMRVYLPISVKAKTLEAAMEKYQKRCEKIRSQVIALGGKADSVHFKSASTAEGDQQRQMLEQMQSRMGGQGSLPKGLTAATSVTLSSTLVADWPLMTDSAEQNMLEADRLTKKILEADLSGVKADAAEQTPEEKELAEEMQNLLRQNYGGNEEAKPGVPQVAYVATLTEQQQDDAMAEGYQNARTNASRMAKAVGSELGPLTKVSGSLSSDYSAANGWESYNPYNPYARRAFNPQSELKEGEGISAQPGEINFVFMVQAAFNLKAK